MFVGDFSGAFSARVVEMHSVICVQIGEISLFNVTATPQIGTMKASRA